MQIIRPSPTTCRLYTIPQLSVVKYSGQYYIVTVSPEEKSVICLNLGTGMLDSIEADAEVELMHSELKIFGPRDVQLTEDETRYIRDGRIIEAIKSIRERTGVGYQEGKAMVDAEKARW